MPCLVDIAGRPDLFWREMEEEWMRRGQGEERGKGLGVGEGRGHYDWNGLYERRTNKKPKKNSVQWVKEFNFYPHYFFLLAAMRWQPLSHDSATMMCSTLLLPEAQSQLITDYALANMCQYKSFILFLLGVCEWLKSLTQASLCLLMLMIVRWMFLRS